MDKQQHKEYKRLLIISHNSFSDTKSNGKVLTSLFRTWPKDKIAQLYFWNEWPSQTVCSRFFRLRDHDILKGNLTGKPAEGTEIDQQTSTPDTPASDDASRKSIVSSVIYGVFANRVPIAELTRDIMWRKSKYASPQLIKWLDTYKPEVLFLQGSYMSFAYRIALWICDQSGAQLQISLTDDETFVKNRFSPFAWINYARLHKWFSRSLRKSSATYAIVPAMKEAFEAKYKCENMHFASNGIDVRPFDDEEQNAESELQLLYAGNVGLNRWKILRSLGKSLCELKKKGCNARLEVYSPVHVPEKIQKALTIGNVMSYEGSLKAEELAGVIKRSNVLVHVESFGRKYRRVTRLSLSTKIAESLISGRCLLAIGPGDVSSIGYLKDFAAAHVICSNNTEQVEREMLPIFNADYRRRIAKTAYSVALKNHDVEKIRKTIWDNLC